MFKRGLCHGLQWKYDTTQDEHGQTIHVQNEALSMVHIHAQTYAHTPYQDSLCFQ